jgi:hypothetical protein
MMLLLLHRRVKQRPSIVCLAQFLNVSELEVAVAVFIE